MIERSSESHGMTTGAVGTGIGMLEFLAATTRMKQQDECLEPSLKAGDMISKPQRESPTASFWRTFSWSYLAKTAYPA